MSFDELFLQITPHLRRQRGLHSLDLVEAEAALAAAPTAPTPVQRVEQVLAYFRERSAAVHRRHEVELQSAARASFGWGTISGQVTAVLRVMAAKGQVSFASA